MSIFNKEVLDLYRYETDHKNPFVDEKGILLDKPWNYRSLSENPNITWDIVLDNPNIEWNYQILSKNPNITWDIVKNNPNIEWNYSSMSRNPNITWDIVKNNPDIKWDYEQLLYNKFQLHDYFIKKWLAKRLSKVINETNRTLLGLECMYCDVISVIDEYLTAY